MGRIGLVDQAVIPDLASQRPLDVAQRLTQGVEKHLLALGESRVEPLDKFPASRCPIHHPHHLRRSFVDDLLYQFTFSTSCTAPGTAPHVVLARTLMPIVSCCHSDRRGVASTPPSLMGRGAVSSMWIVD